MMMTTTAIIKESGHEVIQARDGKEALYLYHSENPDLVLLDVEMPEYTGFEVAKIIRSENKHAWVPIIFLTGFEDDEHLSQGIEAGGDDYLTKPVSPMVLNAKLNAMLRISDMRNKLVSLTKELFNTTNKLQKSVVTDPLTGAKNRLYLDECMNREWYRGMRNKTVLSVLLIDIDYFKILNDTNGHQAGDRCLVKIVKVITSHLKRATDELCRYGGDEFVVILPDTSVTNAMHIAEIIRAGIEKYNSALESKLEIPTEISVSIGCASCIPNDKLTTDELMHLADKALYAAKDAGRNCVKADTSTNKSIAA